MTSRGLRLPAKEELLSIFPLGKIEAAGAIFWVWRAIRALSHRRQWLLAA